MPKLTKYSITLVMALLAILFLAACANKEPCNIVLSLGGGSGETPSEAFSIEGIGEIQLMLYQVLSWKGIEVKLYKLYEDSESELFWEDTWQRNGDKYDDIPPGEYYLKIYLEETVPMPAFFYPGPSWYIEVRDYPVQEP